MSNPEVQELARQLVELQRKFDSLTGPQLSHSSWENAGSNSYVDGQLAGRVGTQFDGSNGFVAFNGPTPPTPSWDLEGGGEPVTPEIGGIKVRWGGLWVQTPADFNAGRVTSAPTGFTRVEVHVSTVADFAADSFATLRTTIESPRGGEVVIATSQEPQYVRLVARTNSGVGSYPSRTVGPIQPGRVIPEIIDIDLDAIGGTTIYWGADEPSAEAGDTLRIGDMWLKKPDNVAYRWEGETDGWVLVADQRIATALQEATDAATVAATADGRALAALGAAGAAQGDAEAALAAAQQAADDASAAYALAQQAQTGGGGGIAVYRQSSQPSTGTFGVNDLWINTADNNRLYAWSGSAWVLSDDQRIATALTTATAAGTTAASKTTVFAQTSQPSTTGRTVGDIWLDTDDGNKRYVWNGAWTASAIGASGISATARQLGAITTYKQATAPASGMLLGDFWIDSDDNKIYRYSGTTWEASQDAAINQAITNAATAQATADGKVRIFIQTTAPTGLVAGDAGDTWIDTDDSNVLYTWSGTAWQKRQLGNGAIQPASLVLSQLAVTGSVTAALLEAVMVLTNTMVIGNPTGDRITISGIEATGATPAGIGIQQITGGLVTFQLSPGGGAYFAGVLSGQSSNYQEARSGWRIGEDGGASFQRLNVFESINAQSASLSSLTLAGQDMFRLLSARPLGLISQGFDGSQNRQGLQSETGIVELGFIAYPGRGYYIDINGPVYGTSDINVIPYFMVRSTIGGAAPDTGSTIIQQIGDMPGGPIPNGTYPWRSLSTNFLWYPPVTSPNGTQVRLLLTIGIGGGSSSGSVGFDSQKIRCQMSVYDMGSALPNSMRINNAQTYVPPSGGGTPQPPAPPPPPPPVQRYEETFYTTWGATYRPNGTRWSVNEEGWGYQGNDGYNGDMASLHGFDLNYIRGKLAGATIKSATFYARAGHTYTNAGGVMLLGSHGNDGMPGNGGQIVAFKERRSSTPVARGGWAGVDALGIMQEIQNYQASGFVFGKAGTNDRYYQSYFFQYPHPDRPRVVVSWEK